MKGPTPEAELTRAQAEVEAAKKRLASSVGALQYRLSPGTLMNNAWDGVREKGGTVADDALQAVKDRPMTVSGVVAAFFIFLARDPLWRFVSRLFRPRTPAEEGTIKADLDHHDKNFDLTAPTVERSTSQGVNA
ncbi:MAG TPA: DUF3618 domain-containing protein [Allosphingosinicella sp.]|jgi:hypothetical protein